MEQQQVAEPTAPHALDVKAEVTEPEPQLDASAGSPMDVDQNKKKKKKKKKNRRKSLEKTQSEVKDLIDDLKANDDKPQSEEEDNQESSIEDTTVNEENQESTVVEENQESTVVEEGTVTQSTVTEENQDSTVIEESTVAQSTVTEESSVAESAVATESTVTQESTVISTVTENVSIEKETVAVDGVNEDELEPPSLERTSSLDTLKASGTKAVGSLFSRFKVGRKKPSPSRTESAAKLEGVVPSPVKTAVKKLEVPEEKNLDDLPMRTKRDFFGDGEQTIHVSAEKEKYDALEKQRKEKEAEEAARHSPPSSTRSNSEVQAQIAAASEQIEVATSTVESSMKTADKEVVDNGADSTVATDSTPSEVVIEETVKTEVVAPAPATVSEGESTGSVVEEQSEPASVSMDTVESVDKQIITTEVNEGNTVSEATANQVTKAGQDSADTTKMEPVSSKLDLDLTEASEASQLQDEVVSENNELQSSEAAVATLTTASVEDGKSIKTEQSETKLTEGTELLSVKITPVAELPTEVTEPAKPEKMSPVKSLASRFEGKREQSLDSLKFRTVREFFPTERSIRVGAEKQKYEAQAQQQQQKAKAEEEAKSKYKTGSGFKATDKENESGEPSPGLKVAVTDELASAPTPNPVELTGFSTPDNASNRKKFSFDEGNASANSPSKFSDEALTPVKSIASRFEGKREQSLDSLKFRTVREFFPEERSVRVGSEKQKFEAQAQQGNSLDNLKLQEIILRPWE
ncbi:Adhesin-like protein [Phytophthora palmivora]|uniref:Adhesin-like protein n=1 Tax=Phytophthora palmivora TaxID=4796 RepID=A0A2P4YTQ9_9STRA|nr:Adhesin-like protein [Phytophthora palmivora]